MAIVLADVGADAMLKCYFNNTRPAGGNNLTIKLFVNNITPNPNGGDTAATYTEAAGGGYVAQTLTCGSWTITVGNDPSDAVYNTTITFTFTGALTGNATIYGYYIVDADGVLIYSEKTSTMIPANNGDVYKVPVKFALSYGTPQA